MTVQEKRMVVAVFDKSRPGEPFYTWMVFCNDGTIWRVTQDTRPGFSGFRWADYSMPQSPQQFTHLPQPDEYVPRVEEYVTA